MEPFDIAQIVVAATQDAMFALAVGALACGAMLGRQDHVPLDALAGLGRWRFGLFCGLALALCPSKADERKNRP
ncbi:hypothetical protein [Paraburkholderia sp. BL10I2N1]|uniref:hypothetical protein n=1 Tax=Paraburkholderia sp. BL10I2N1 TaxID=1938796 RepID=UPI00105F7470|nr:hypothetical protein [Paraburkholderia sp. BL10I2N1]TDN62024.1 hypothetical protein B0G77_5543 [Paraburkholderia sp. BL10I2N1]